MSTLDLDVLDLRERDHNPAAFDARLHATLARWGFVAVVGHGIPTQQLDAAYAAAAQFFAQPGPAKRAWERPEIGRQRGYTGFGVEHAKDRAVHDLKEFWQLGPPEDAPELPPNVWPELPGFQGSLETLFRSMNRFATRLLYAIASGAGLDADAIVEGTHQGNSVLRVLHYPPTRSSDPADAVRAAAHEDINLLTVLPASTQPGLELLDRDGTWRALRTPPDVLVCDTGDIFQRLTSGALPSTTHRVVNPPGGANASRYSLPFFMHPRPSWVVRSQAGDQPPITAGDFLTERLVANRML